MSPTDSRQSPCQRQGHAILIATIMLAAVAKPCSGQEPAGQVEERVISTTDTAQTYALYLPPGYTADRRWPVLFVLDPRGRAMLGLELFDDAAARHGWIILSSYNTRSDTTTDPNANALEAMLASAQARLSIDPTRLYLAGFSGTARVALRLAVALRGHVAGVIAAGGALAFELGGPETVFARESTFAYLGAAGTEDFNYEEVLAMGERFRTTGVPARIAVFEGPHGWPPPEICRDALEWLELRAMLGGLRPMDSAWVRTRLEAELARAEELYRGGRWEEALRLHEAIVFDYRGWPEASRAGERAGELRESPVLQRHDAERRRLAERDQRQASDLQKALAWARSRSAPPSLESLLKKLRVPELQRTIERGDSLEAASARRLLARTFVWLAFYEPRAYLADASPDRALRMFEAAVTIGRIRGEACALLNAALVAATAEQKARLTGQCPARRPRSQVSPPSVEDS